MSFELLLSPNSSTQTTSGSALQQSLLHTSRSAFRIFIRHLCALTTEKFAVDLKTLLSRDGLQASFTKTLPSTSKSDNFGVSESPIGLPSMPSFCALKALFSLAFGMHNAHGYEISSHVKEWVSSEGGTGFLNVYEQYAAQILKCRRELKLQCLLDVLLIFSVLNLPIDTHAPAINDLLPQAAPRQRFSTLLNQIEDSLIKEIDAIDWHVCRPLVDAHVVSAKQRSLLLIAALIPASSNQTVPLLPQLSKPEHYASFVNPSTSMGELASNGAPYGQPTKRIQHLPTTLYPTKRTTAKFQPLETNTNTAHAEVPSVASRTPTTATADGIKRLYSVQSSATALQAAQQTIESSRETAKQLRDRGKAFLGKFNLY